jgi:hypothetical protein
MSMRARIKHGLALFLAVTLLAACGGGEDRTKAKLRLVNASAYPGLDLIVDDERRFSAVAYGGSADYAEVDPENTDSEIRRPDAGTPLLSFTPALAEQQSYTVLAYGAEGALRSVLLDDNTGAPSSGKASLRFVNAAPDAGALDIYVTDADEPLGDAVPLQAGAAVGAVSSYTTLNNGNRRLRVTGAGSKTDLRLDISGIALGSEFIGTLVLTAGRGGVLVNALLLAERGAIQRADGAQARVRVAAAVTESGSVAASVGGAVLMNGVGAPAVALYALVPAGTPAVAVAVDGQPVAAADAALAVGADYTLLVYGPASAPVVAWIEDDNRPPRDSNKARVRLVHGVASLPGPLALSADFVPVADGVLPGTASAITEIAATATARLSVTTPGQATPVWGAVDQVFRAGGNYTLFVVGAAAAPAGMLIKDR